MKAEEAIRLLAEEYGKACQVSNFAKESLDRITEARNTLTEALSLIENAQMNLIEDSNRSREALESANKRNEEVRVSLLSSLVTIERLDKEVQLLQRDLSSAITELKRRDKEILDLMIENNENIVSTIEKLSGSVQVIFDELKKNYAQLTLLIEQGDRSIQDLIKDRELKLSFKIDESGSKIVNDLAALKEKLENYYGQMVNNFKDTNQEITLKNELLVSLLKTEYESLIERFERLDKESKARHEEVMNKLELARYAAVFSAISVVGIAGVLIILFMGG
ncbi:MAG: hypothetical protein HPY73_01455 [Methanomassiliicoccales archaeon]|nr:MAG: hypothetical protein HPY73_01455 [Methanomassiliicoccales archaeon]